MGSGHFSNMSRDEIEAERMRLLEVIEARGQKAADPQQSDIAELTEIQDLVREAEHLLGEAGERD